MSRFRPSSVRVSKREPNTRGDVIEVPKGLVKRLTFPKMSIASTGGSNNAHLFPPNVFEDMGTRRGPYKVTVKS